VVTRSAPSFMTRHPQGATAATSRYRPKESFFAEVKSCNYLLNALMKKEAVERNVDFVLAFTESGILGEGATENAGIVSSDGRLLFPRLEGILHGTTMLRVAELAEVLVHDGALQAIAFEDVSASAVAASREILIVGTTRDVVAVTQFDGRPVGDGRPGRVFHALAGLLQEDMLRNPAMRTPVF
ncbi:MAG: aminotransferase class IV, partial [Kiritimatiellae bacterium]|nr:aminotransferase class IV [Kiritimatiellia bacterium]